MNKARRTPDESGVAYWLRMAEWCRQQKHLLSVPPMEGAQAIQRRFNVSRATAYRWLAAWREVNGGTARIEA